MMTKTLSLADAIRAREPDALARLASSVIKVRPDNLIERPWGGTRLLGFKGLAVTKAVTAERFGESFELSASLDPEAATHPSIVEFEDESELPLPELLDVAGPALLGEALARECGGRLPLLPKILDIRELLSVQTHPWGLPEVYVVLEAEEGATIRLGFRCDVDPQALRATLLQGREAHERLLSLLRPGVDQPALQAAWAPVLGRRESAARDLLGVLEPYLQPGVGESQALPEVETLRGVYWEILDLLNEVAVRPGDVIFNATPSPAGVLSADIHALGNPEAKEILLLEVRMPGPTLRAWDNGRFPPRPLDIDTALANLKPARTEPGDFILDPRPVPGSPGVFCCVECDFFTVDLLTLAPGGSFLAQSTAGLASTLHAVASGVRVLSPAGVLLASLRQGESALLPASLGRYLLASVDGEARVVRVTLPKKPSATPPARAENSSVRSSAPPEAVALRFGTSGLRGLVRDMTDREVYINICGFLRYLRGTGETRPGEAVALAEDLRRQDSATGISSSPRIARAVARAARDEGLKVVYCGRIPTPALANFARLNDPAGGKAPMPGVMVTGSHIPADRNGIKFYKTVGEILKADEAGILAEVGEVRAQCSGAADSLFDDNGAFRAEVAQEPLDPRAEEFYVARYTGLFAGERPLRGMRLVLYEHSAVGRDILKRILESLGAGVISVGRSEDFVPVDTENVRPEDEALYRDLVLRHGADALVSTDGDGDRPLLVDEGGRLRSGDVIGLVTAESFLGAEFAAVPISVTDALERRAEERASLQLAPPMTVRRTRIGSPYVIEAMAEAVAQGSASVVGWEANGGFLTGTSFSVNGRKRLTGLPTRDAVLPILAVLLSAAGRGVRVSSLFDELPRRATSSGLLNGVSAEEGRAVVARCSLADARVVDLEFRPEGVFLRSADGARRSADGPETQAAGRIREFFLERHFTPALGFFGVVECINYLDGVRISFAGGDVVHLRPSGNAPQFRVYAASDRRRRAEEIVALATAEPGGIVRRMLREVLS
ncbi:MAG: type I phosphomannose isomerase catalytic subunit [Pseudomonadota bacterium]